MELVPEAYEVLRLHTKSWGLVTGTSVSDPKEVGTDCRLLQDLCPKPNPDFSNFMLTRWAWEKVGPFDEGFEGAYCEDADYHVRLHRAGVPAFSIDLPVLHHRSSTLRFSEPEEKAKIVEYGTKNRERFRKRYGCMPYGAKYDKLFMGEST